MAKDKKYNPVQEQRKADKAKAIKKGKADVQEKRNERLAQKNPDRIQQHIDELKSATTNGGKLSSRDEELLKGLEKELKAVNKAREALGDKAPKFGKSWKRDGDSGGRVLGKRRRGSQTSTDEDVPEDVRSIPMPRDTPPPIPKEVLDKWYARRRARRQAQLNADNPAETEGKKEDAPVVESKTVYEAKPIVRDLRKEAVAAFVPSSVQMKMSKGQGQGGLIEPEEADKLEKEGYMKVAGSTSGSGSGSRGAPAKDTTSSLNATIEDADDED